MKKIKYSHILVIVLLLVLSCKQEVIVPTPEPTPDPGPAPTAGSVSFTKFVAVGNSFVAGVQGGALFTDGQNNSLPAIMAKQFALVGGGAFKQPTIGASLGYNLFVTPNPGADGKVMGRMLLQYNGATSPKPTPQKYAAGVLEAVPNPSLNPGFIYTGGKATLNNFGIPAILLGQALIPQTGSWALAGTDPRFSPFYGRLAAPPGGTTTLIGDAAAAGGSFFMVWLGLDDFFLYAAFGGDPTKAPLTPGSGGLPSGFDGQYAAVLNTLLTANPNAKGVVANFPDIFVMPHFTSIPYNSIVFKSTDAATVTATNSAYAAYNGGLDTAFGANLITAAERDKRKINFIIGANGIVIEDETLTNLSGLGLPSIRQATSGDIFPLSAGNVLGTQFVPGNAATTWGVGKALTDQYALIPSEITAIKAARDSYNSTIAGLAAANTSRVALADVSAAMATLVTNQAAVSNNVTLTPNINPPTGIYSEDGVHPNSRGYAYIANVFITAINNKFGATIPLADVSQYSATGLPIP